MDNSHHFARLQKTRKRRFPKGYPGINPNPLPQGRPDLTHTPRSHLHRATRRARQNSRKLCRQALLSRNLRIPTKEDEKETLDYYKQKPAKWKPWWKYETLYYDRTFEYNERLREFNGGGGQWYDGFSFLFCPDISPWRGDYEDMTEGPCPLCGGECIRVMKREIEEDEAGEKWPLYDDDIYEPSDIDL